MRHSRLIPYPLLCSAYRAPELMFAPPVYDACATDIWSLGVLLTSFFTPLRLIRKSSWDDDDLDGFGNEDTSAGENDSSSIPPFIGSDIASRGGSTVWTRETLFNGSRGELGLVWSIFKVKGTPDLASWPVSKTPVIFMN